MKPIIYHTDKEHKQKMESYHSGLPKLSENGKPLLSASEIKKMINLSWRPEKDSTIKGSATHKYLSDKLILGSCPLIQAERKGSKKHEVQLEQCAELYPKGNYIMMPPAKLAEITELAIQVDPLLKTLRAANALSETVVYVSPALAQKAIKDNIVKNDFSRQIINWATKNGDYGMRAMIDVLYTDPQGIVRMIDWKSTAKDNMDDLLGQVHSLNYLWSLYWYRAALNCVGIEISPNVTFCFLHAKKTVNIEFDLDCPNLFAKYVAPMLTKPIGKIVYDYEQFRAPNKTYACSIDANTGWLTAKSKEGRTEKINNEIEQINEETLGEWI